MKDGLLAVSMKSLRIESCAVDEIFLLMHSKSLKHSLRFHDTYAKKVKHPGPVLPGGRVHRRKSLAEPRKDRILAC